MKTRRTFQICQSLLAFRWSKKKIKVNLKESKLKILKQNKYFIGFGKCKKNVF